MKITGMLEMDYDGMTMYATALRVGAVALILDKATDELSAGIVTEVVTAGFGAGYFLTAKDMLCDRHGVCGEFIDFENDEIAFVGIDFIDECEDRKVLKSFYDYVEWEWEHFDEDGMFAGIIVPDELFGKREKERYRHIAHRAIKRRMYADRVARRNAKKGV